MGTLYSSLGSVFECDLLSSYIVYNHDLPAFIDPDNPQLIVSLFELGMLYDYEKLHLFAECAHILQKLDLVPEEQAMLYAYMVLTSGILHKQNRYLTVVLEKFLLFKSVSILKACYWNLGKKLCTG